MDIKIASAKKMEQQSAQKMELENGNVERMEQQSAQKMEWEMGMDKNGKWKWRGAEKEFRFVKN